MRFYNQAHAFYAGVDLHARSNFTHVLDQSGATVFAQDLPARPDAFLHAIAPFRQGLVVGCECMCAWYWLADLCEDESIPFTLGDRARRFAWPAPGTERFLGRDGEPSRLSGPDRRSRRRVATRVGLTPYSCLAPPRSCDRPRTT